MKGFSLAFALLTVVFSVSSPLAFAVTDGAGTKTTDTKAAYDKAKIGGSEETNTDPNMNIPDDSTGVDKAVYDNARSDGATDTAASAAAGGGYGCDSGNIDNVADCLDGKKPNGVISVGDGKLTGSEGVKSKIVAITNRVISAVALIAIAAIVFAGFHMVTAYGDDEKHKKGKEALKWGILGFATALLSFALVNAVVNFFYRLN